MAHWKYINFNYNRIIAESDRSVLITMPKTSKYSDYSFWHLKKLTRESGNSETFTISFNEDFVFHLKKYGEGKYNKYDVLNEIDIDAFEFERQFKRMDENIISGIKK